MNHNLSAGQQKINLVYLVGAHLSMTQTVDYHGYWACNILGKYKRNRFDWYNLIYDSLGSAIINGWHVFFLAKIKWIDLIGTALSMTHIRRRLWKGVRVIYLAKIKRMDLIGTALSVTHTRRRLWSRWHVFCLAKIKVIDLIGIDYLWFTPVGEYG